MRHHKVFAVLALAGFAAHLAANLFVEFVPWLPEDVWFASIVCAVLAVYGGAATACRAEGSARGTAIASAVIGAVVLLGLFYSGVTWLFMMGEGYELAV